MKTLLSMLLLSIVLPIGGNSFAQPPENAVLSPSWETLAEKNILAWTPQEQLLGYPNIRKINPVREIPPSSDPLPLPRKLWPPSHRWDEEMAELHLTGLVIVEDGTIRFEGYRQGHSKDQRWMSFSIAKSVVSLLYGFAIAEGHIDDLDETVADHMAQFEGSGYADVRLRDLLQMASGVQWNEDYADPESDVAKLDNASEAKVLEHLASLPSLHAPGTVFNYNTGETILAGAILSQAVGMSLSEYLSLRIWSPYGMESGADWALMGEDGAEMGGCCISATLRDYARLGLATLENTKGSSASTPLPTDWMRQSTTPSASAPFYGNFWWIMDNGDYRAVGIFGQAIHISPSRNLVIAMHGAWPEASSDELSAKRADLIKKIKAASMRFASD